MHGVCFVFLVDKQNSAFSGTRSIACYTNAKLICQIIAWVIKQIILYPHSSISENLTSKINPDAYSVFLQFVDLVQFSNKFFWNEVLNVCMKKGELPWKGEERKKSRQRPCSKPWLIPCLQTVTFSVFHIL